MNPRNEYDTGMGLIRTMLGMCGILVVLGAGTTYSVATQDRSEAPKTLEDEANLPFTVISCNDTSYVVKTSSYGLYQLDSNKNMALLVDLDGNSIVSDKQNIKEIGKFSTYDEAMQFINNNVEKTVSR